MIIIANITFASLSPLRYYSSLTNASYFGCLEMLRNQRKVQHELLDSPCSLKQQYLKG